MYIAVIPQKMFLFGCSHISALNVIRDGENLRKYSLFYFFTLSSFLYPNQFYLLGLVYFTVHKVSVGNLVFYLEIDMFKHSPIKWHVKFGLACKFDLLALY